ncbi:MAG: hypothetical protein JWP52_2022 [Rhizobacter sp.]|nr:hypothetical protein [Rhizobacter sp.]
MKPVVVQMVGWASAVVVLAAGAFLWFFGGHSAGSGVAVDTAAYSATPQAPGATVAEMTSGREATGSLRNQVGVASVNGKRLSDEGSTASSAASGASRAVVDKDGFTETNWDTLVPDGWDPNKDLKGLKNLDQLGDADPKAVALLKKLRDVWDAAPVAPELNGKRVRIAGYVVPLDESSGKVSEFLLVPYFGACIHVPPPPANQIIHAIAAKPAEVKTMDAVWINGTLRTVRADTSMGSAGYAMDVDSVSPYLPVAGGR